jgi:hypothetical protein
MAKAPRRGKRDRSLENEFASEQRTVREKPTDIETFVLWLTDTMPGVRRIKPRYWSLVVLVLVTAVWVGVRSGVAPVARDESALTTVDQEPTAPVPAPIEDSVAVADVLDEATRVADPPVAVDVPRAAVASEPASPRVVAPRATAASRVATTETAPRPSIDVPLVAPAPPMPPAPAAASSPVEDTTPSSPPAAVRATAASSVSTPILNPEGEIHDVLGRYRSALGALDSRAVRQVWPTVNQRSLERALGQLQEQDVSFFSCSIDVKGEAAQAVCVGTTSFVPKVGSRSPQSGPSQWNFSLRRDNGAWQIENVVAQ